MATELSVMEQRYQAVSAVIHDGLSVVEVSNRFGVSRQTIHSWLLKYEKSGLPRLTNHSHKPRSCSHQVSTEIDVLICEMRRRNPIWGPKRIAHELAKRDIGLMPWQSGIYLEDRSELKCLTGVDDHSRFCVSADRMHRANSKSACGHFLRSLGRYGIPQEILTDNDKVITGRKWLRCSQPKLCVIRRILPSRMLLLLKDALPNIRLDGRPSYIQGKIRATSLGARRYGLH